MLKELKFVQGAVAKKDFVPAMTHFSIEGGRVRSYNGMIALSSPLPFDIDCKPKAVPLVKAIERCNETITLAMTPAGRLRVQSGDFKAFVDCTEEDGAHVNPEGDEVAVDGEALLKALKVVSPFIGNDASRPWSNGVLLSGCSAYATNNATAIEYWVGVEFPRRVNIPKAAINEMLRINEAPERVQLAETSITFHYSDGRWVRSQLLSLEWPDFSKVLDCECAPAKVNEELFNSLANLKPFVDSFGRVYLDDNGVSTTPPGNDEGASNTIEGLGLKGVYRLEMLQLLQGVATQVDFSTYPAPCLFFGELCRGAIIGIREDL